MSTISLLLIALLQGVAAAAGEQSTTSTAAAADPRWQPTPATEQAVRARSEAFLEARDRGMDEAARAMLTQGMQDQFRPEAFAARVRQYREESGASRGRRIIRVRWFNDPPGAQLHGIFAVADFTADYERLHVACGSLIWLLQSDGSWRLFRISEATLPRSERPNATPQEVAEARRAMECPD